MTHTQATRQLELPIAIIGAGVTGLSCARFLSARFDGQVMIFDTRESAPHQDELKALLGQENCHFGEIDFSLVSQMKTLVVSPGLDLRSPQWKALLESDDITLLGDIALFLAFCDKPVAAVTGTNGKSTVVSLLAHFGQAQGLSIGLGGNFGVPAVDLLEQGHSAYVLELSSFQLDLLNNPSFLCACLLNVSPDHLDRYDSYDDYILSKKRIFAGAKHAVFNGADVLTQPLDLDQQVNVIFQSAKHSPTDFVVEQRAEEFVISCDGKDILNTERSLLKGAHNAANIAAALACAAAMDWDLEKAAASLSSFKGLPHRCEWVAKIQDVAFIDDSKGTNIGATQAAIEGLQSQYSNIHWIAGGVGKDQDFALLSSVCQKHVSNAVLIGRDAPALAKELAPVVECVVVENMQLAVQTAFAKAQKGDLVLLSPACASFDMYSGYEQRGRDFVHCVKQLGEAA